MKVIACVTGNPATELQVLSNSSARSLRPVGFLPFTLPSVMSVSCSSRLFSWMSLWHQQKLELVALRVKIRASLLQTLNKIPKFWVICLSLKQKIWPEDKIGFNPIWAPLCDCGQFISTLHPWLLYSKERCSVSAKEAMPISTMIYKYICVCTCGYMYTQTHTCIHTHPSTEKTQLNYQADSFVHFLIQATHIYSAPILFQILF